MVSVAKFLLLILLPNFWGYSLSTSTTNPNEGVTLADHPFAKLCNNFTCPYRHTCTIGIKNKKLPTYEEKCSCMCSNVEACRPEKISSTQCYCDKNIYGDDCSSGPIPAEQLQCERSDWKSYCQPQCTKPYIEKVLCNNMNRDPWDSCDASEKCINSYNNGICDSECNNKGCLFDGDDCQPTQPCSTCDFTLTTSKQPICDGFCETIKRQMNQTINRKSKSEIYLEVEFQSSYGLAYVNLVSLMEQLSLKFSVVFNVALGADMKPVMYSKYSKTFSRITTTILFTLDSRKCIADSCVVNPHQMANNLMASSYLKKDTLMFKVVNANGHMLENRSDFYSFENGYFLLIFVGSVVLTASIFVGSMYYTHQNSYWPNTITSSSNSNISSQSSTLLNITENDSVFHDRTPDITQIKPAAFSNWKSDSYMLTVTPEDIKENLYMTMTPSNYEAENNILTKKSDVAGETNFSKPPIASSSTLQLLNSCFGNWSSLVRYSNRKQRGRVLPYGLYVPTAINGVSKAITTTMDTALLSNLPSTLFKFDSDKSLFNKNNINNTNNSNKNRPSTENIGKKIDLSKYAAMNCHTNTIIHDCVKNGILMNSEDLMNTDIPFMELKNEQSFHPILLSVIYSRADWLDYFCNNGVSLDSHDNNGWRSVHWAAATNDIKVMKILHQYRANFEVLTITGETPLMIACRESSLETIIMLLRAKVSLVQLNYLNMDCVDIAIENDRLAVLSLLYHHLKSYNKGKNSEAVSNLNQKINNHLAKYPHYLNKVAEKFSQTFQRQPSQQVPQQQTIENFTYPNYNSHPNQPLSYQYDPSHQVNSGQAFAGSIMPGAPPTINTNNPYSQPFNYNFSHPTQNNVDFYIGDNQPNYCDIQKRVYCPLQSNVNSVNANIITGNINQRLSLSMDNTHYVSDMNFKIGKFNHNQPPLHPNFPNSYYAPNMNLLNNHPNYLLSTPSVDNFLNMVQAHMNSFSSQNNSTFGSMDNIHHQDNNNPQYQMDISESFPIDDPNNSYSYSYNPANRTDPSDPYMNSNR